MADYSKLGPKALELLGKGAKRVPTPVIDPRELRIDNPGGGWLKGKIEEAEASRSRSPVGAPRSGATTGYFRGDPNTVVVPVEELARLRGLSDEQNKVRYEDLNWLIEHMGTTGNLPEARKGTEYVPFVNVDHTGRGWVNEGNHRIMAAKALGWDTLPVELNYLNGGEAVPGRLSPEKLLEYFTRYGGKGAAATALSPAALEYLKNADDSERPKYADGGKVAKALEFLRTKNLARPYDPIMEAGVAAYRKEGYPDSVIARLTQRQIYEKSGMWRKPDEPLDPFALTEDDAAPSMRVLQKADGGKVAGFVSKLGEFLSSSKAPKTATVEQWRNTMKNAGVKQDEMDWTGVTDALNKFGDRKVTLDEVKSAFKPYQLNEKALGDALSPSQRRELQRLERRFMDEEGGLTDTEEELYNELTAKMEGKGARFNDPNYKLPGGENYREILLKAPNDRAPTVVPYNGRWAVKTADGTIDSTYYDRGDAERALAFVGRKTGDQFHSSHWPDDPNTLVHLRAQDRDVGGKRALHIEEVQSDWHQKGRKEGYKQPENPQLKADVENTQAQFAAHLRRMGLDDGEVSSALSQARSGRIPSWVLGDPQNEHYATDMIDAVRAWEGQGRAVPDAPLKKNWEELGWKRALQEAVNGGYDKLVWTTGKDQAARYDLSKHIDGITATAVDASGSEYIIYMKLHDGRSFPGRVVSADKLEETVGKDLAEKIRKDVQTPDASMTYSGLDLQVGGEGMKAAYDDRARSILKKLTGQEPKLESSGVPPEYDRLITNGDLRAAGYEDHPIEVEHATDGSITVRNRYTGETTAATEATQDSVVGEMLYRALGRVAPEGGKLHSIDLTPDTVERVRKGLPLFVVPAMAGAAAVPGEAQAAPAAQLGPEAMRFLKPAAIDAEIKAAQLAQERGALSHGEAKAPVLGITGQDAGDAALAVGELLEPMSWTQSKRATEAFKQGNYPMAALHTMAGVPALAMDVTGGTAITRLLSKYGQKAPTVIGQGLERVGDMGTRNIGKLFGATAAPAFFPTTE